MSPVSETNFTHAQSFDLTVEILLFRSLLVAFRNTRSGLGSSSSLKLVGTQNMRPRNTPTFTDGQASQNEAATGSIGYRHLLPDHLNDDLTREQEKSLDRVAKCAWRATGMRLERVALAKNARLLRLMLGLTMPHSESASRTV